GRCALNHGLVGRQGRKRGSRGGEHAHCGHGVTLSRRRGSSNHGEAKQQRRERAPPQGLLHGHPEGPKAHAQDRLRHKMIRRHDGGVSGGRAGPTSGDNEREGAGEVTDERGEAAATDEGGAGRAAVGGGASRAVAVGGGAAGPAVQGGGARRAVGGHRPGHAGGAAGARAPAAGGWPRGGVPRPRGAGLAGRAPGRRRARLRSRWRRRRRCVHVRVQAAELLRLIGSARAFF
ncbi:unnamed protein product, partial [Urochloa humidicola]